MYMYTFTIELPLCKFLYLIASLQNLENFLLYSEELYECKILSEWLKLFIETINWNGRFSHVY